MRTFPEEWPDISGFVRALFVAITPGFALWSLCSLTHLTDLLISDHLHFPVAVSWNRGTKLRVFGEKKGNLKGFKTSWKACYCLSNMIVTHRKADTDTHWYSQMRTFQQNLTWKFRGKSGQILGRFWQFILHKNQDKEWKHVLHVKL